MEEEYVCTACGESIAEVVHNYSMKNFNKPLCRECQTITRNNGQQQEQKPTNGKASNGGKYSHIDSKHIIQLNGKEFITHAGLLDAAHKAGLVRIDTEIVNIFTDDKITGDSNTSTGVNCVIFKTMVTMKESDGTLKTYTAHGDANPNNVGRHIAEHMIRMAETRSVNRALRFATNIGMCSVDELSDQK